MELFIIILAGLLAGVATGLVGLSAAIIIVPLLSTFLGMDPYMAIGIALASDVLASAFSAATYSKNKNIDIKGSLPLLLSVLIVTIIGSYVASLRDTETLASMTNVIIIVMGIRFLVRPNKTKEVKPLSHGKRIQLQILWGCLVGFICGYMGAGGGVALLMVLSSVLGYELKTAVGTSVFIMAFTALVGASSHIVIMPPDVIVLIISSICALIGARVAATYANKIDPIKLNKVVGIFMIIFGIAITVINKVI